MFEVYIIVICETEGGAQLPTYDLKCQDCGHEFSAFCKISEKDKQLCPKCSSNKLNTIFKSFNRFSGGAGSGSGSSDLPLPPSGGYG